MVLRRRRWIVSFTLPPLHNQHTQSTQNKSLYKSTGVLSNVYSCLLVSTRDLVLLIEDVEQFFCFELLAAKSSDWV